MGRAWETCGARLTPADSWQLLLESERSLTWQLPGNLALTLRCSDEPLLVDPFLLEDFRHDLRLLAAERGGGLVECELRPDLGAVEGVTKEPQRRVGRGHTYRGHLLVPTARGRVELELIAHEGSGTGEREAAVAAERFGGERPSGWSRDPYGYVYVQLPPESSELDPLPVDLSLRSLADAEGYDLLFPDHPLTRVREALRGLPLELDAPSELRVPRGRSEASGVRFFAPFGFLERGEAPRGQGKRFRRIGFGERRHELWLTLHGGDDTSAPALRSLLPGVRHLRPLRLGRLKGQLSDFVAPRHYGVSFLIGWCGYTLEVHRRGPRDDWRRARADVEATVLSLEEQVEQAPGSSPGAELVSPSGRERIYRVLAWLAVCDGEVGPDERRELDAWRARLDLSVPQTRRLLEEAVQSRGLRVGRRPAEREILIEGMVRLIAADGVLDPNEQQRLQQLAPLLGYGYPELLRQVREALA